MSCYYDYYQTTTNIAMFTIIIIHNSTINIKNNC